MIKHKMGKNSIFFYVYSDCSKKNAYLCPEFGIPSVSARGKKLMKRWL